MKALILSGGRGTRLRPITHTSAKQLVPIANKPILFYAIEAVRNAGIEEIGIIVGETQDEIRAACGDGSRWNCKITYIPQDEPLGLAHAVKIAEPFIGDDPFVMYLGDNFVQNGVASLVDDFRGGGYNAQILLAHVPNPTQFGVAELEAGRVIRLVEKPKEPKTDLALVGVYLFDQSIFKAVNAIKPSARGELEITEAIQYLIDNGYNVHSHILTTYWQDTGKLPDLLEANRVVLEGISAKIDGLVDTNSAIVGKVQLDETAKIINSVVRGPAVIGANTIVENAYIGPFTSISSGCLIRGCEIEHSIVLENSTIDNLGARMEESLIGRNVRVGRSQQKPSAYRLMLGDNSEVSVL